MQENLFCFAEERPSFARWDFLKLKALLTVQAGLKDNASVLGYNVSPSLKHTIRNLLGKSNGIERLILEKTA